MVAVGHSRSAQIAANEGHVGNIVLLSAVDSLFDEAAGPLTTAQIARRLSAQGFPAGSPRRLRSDIRGMLEQYPESFSRAALGWTRSNVAGRT